MKNCIYIIMALVALSVLVPELCFAETIGGTGPFDDLLIEILDVLKGTILTAALVFSAVAYGLSLMLFQHNRETVERGGRIIFGLLIAAKGAGFVADSLGLSFLIY